jgi:hypothetical protein
MERRTPHRTPDRPWWPVFLALAVLPTLVLGFETYSPGAYVLFGLLFLLHTPLWPNPKSGKLWAAVGAVVLAWALFTAAAFEVVLAPEDAHVLVVGLWQAAVLRIFLSQRPTICFGFGILAAMGVASFPLVWGFAWAAGVHTIALVLTGKVAQRATWRTPHTAVRTGFAALYGVFLVGFAAVYAPVMLVGATGAAAAVADVAISCGFLGPTCEGFAHLASRAAYKDAAIGALLLNHTGSVAAAGTLMSALFSWVDARHRAAHIR